MILFPKLSDISIEIKINSSYILLKYWTGTKKTECTIKAFSKISKIMKTLRYQGALNI